MNKDQRAALAAETLLRKLNRCLKSRSARSGCSPTEVRTLARAWKLAKSERRAPRLLKRALSTRSCSQVALHPNQSAPRSIRGFRVKKSMLERFAGVAKGSPHVIPTSRPRLRSKLNRDERPIHLFPRNRMVLKPQQFVGAPLNKTSRLQIIRSAITAPNNRETFAASDFWNSTHVYL